MEMFDWIEKFEGAIPGAAPAECGNWQEQNLNMAKFESKKYNSILKNPSRENLEYPSPVV